MGPTLIGTSKNIIRIRELIKHVAGTGLNIVISGETGVGKEVIAQKLYESSPIPAQKEKKEENSK